MELQDDPLWKIARKRAAFKKHFATYIIVNAFLWALWFFVAPEVLWPIWVTLGWGIGLAFNYVGAYHSTSEDMVRKEYEKLKNEQK